AIRKRRKSRLGVVELLVKRAATTQHGFEDLGGEAARGKAGGLRGRGRHASDVARNARPGHALRHAGRSAMSACLPPRATAAAETAPRTARRTAGRLRRVARPATELARELIERGNTVLGRRMSREQIVHAMSAERIDDEQMR